MQYEEALEIINKYGLNPNFGYGGVSKSYQIDKADMLYNLEDSEYYVSLWEAIGCRCGGYNGHIDNLLLGLVKNYLDENRENNGIFYDKTRQNEIEMLNYIMCSSGILDYGTSPRFPFLSPYGKVILDLYFKQDRPDWLDDGEL